MQAEAHITEPPRVGGRRSDGGVLGGGEGPPPPPQKKKKKKKNGLSDCHRARTRKPARLIRERPPRARSLRRAAPPPIQAFNLPGLEGVFKVEASRAVGKTKPPPPNRIRATQIADAQAAALEAGRCRRRKRRQQG